MTREEAREPLECIYTEVSTETDREALNMAIEALKEPKQGEWIETTHAIVCSNCGHNIEPRQFGSYMRYCCVCGSDNLKEGDEK